MNENNKQAEPVAFNGWYCAQCQRGVAPSEVTFHETHTECGRYITEDEPPAQPVQPAGSQEPVVWVNSANIKSAAISQERGGPFDQHTWSESKTAYHDVPIRVREAPADAQGEPVRFEVISDGKTHQVFQDETKAQDYAANLNKSHPDIVSNARVRPLYPPHPAAAINEHLLEALKNVVKFSLMYRLEESDCCAVDARAAIAAAEKAKGGV